MRGRVGVRVLAGPMRIRPSSRGRARTLGCVALVVDQRQLERADICSNRALRLLSRRAGSPELSRPVRVRADAREHPWTHRSVRRKAAPVVDVRQLERADIRSNRPIRGIRGMREMRGMRGMREMREMRGRAGLRVLARTMRVCRSAWGRGELARTRGTVRGFAARVVDARNLSWARRDLKGRTFARSGRPERRGLRRIHGGWTIRAVRPG
jgi:hypothetical protein